MNLASWDGTIIKLAKSWGSDSDEVLRLKQINGLQELFADRQYSRAWTVDDLKLAQAFSYYQQRRFLLGETGTD